MTYTPPTFNEKAFTCPHCGAYSHMTWRSLRAEGEDLQDGPRWYEAVCASCTESSIWQPTGNQLFSRLSVGAGIMVVPKALTGAPAVDSMPADVRKDYEEARAVAQMSPRSAAALLRLCIQRLCIHLGLKGENINDDIGELVKRGLPVGVQQALDVVRVTGNNAVHPGELSEDELAEVTQKLFAIVNFIVSQQIGQPQEILKLFVAIPSKTQEAIARRDAPRT